mmetsp:Transcript_25861/g.45105  ORF Transcript_25861/g.45105 Transcript_25861/m.45105 type:complete len:217 (+) Transcript_25861:24-674(+)
MEDTQRTPTQAEVILSTSPEKNDLSSEAFYQFHILGSRPPANVYPFSFLPKFKKVELPKAESNEIPDTQRYISAMSAIPESCVFKSLTGVALGGGMGFVMGLVLGAMGDLGPPVAVLHGREVPAAPAREQLRTAYKATLQKSVGWAKNFAAISAIFQGTECVIEKYRGKHDMLNPILSGCAAGAVLAAAEGPQAAALGCMGFAAFSGVVEMIMGGH